MSFDEQEDARAEYEAAIADQALKDDGLRYALQECPDEVEDAVRQWQADEWLVESREWLQLINIVSQHDREQLRYTVRRRADHNQGSEQQATDIDLQLFNTASDISKLLESIAFPPDLDPAGDAGYTETLEKFRYGYRPGSLVPPLARYASYCTVSEDLNWVLDLVALTRAFRNILYAIAEPRKQLSLEWKLGEHIRTIDAALEKGMRPRLVYRGIEGKHHKFGRESTPSTTPLSTLMAEWICVYLVNYSDQIDLGACVECGKIFSRQRRDNAYCSKTCQNRVAYKRKKIFDTGLLERIDITQKTAADRLQPGIWMYHPRLGLGMVEVVGTADMYQNRSLTVHFPHLVRKFFLKDLFQSEPDSKIEFYTETDAAMLAELL